MIKSIFLNHKSKSANAEVDHSTYAEAQHIGILFNADEYDTEIINELKDSIEGDGKSVFTLGFEEKASEATVHFNKKDISGTGGIKKDEVTAFLKQQFDFLIALDTTENINYRYILALSKAKCKIGFETESYSDLLQLSLKPDEEKSASVKTVTRYLKMIS